MQDIKKFKVNINGKDQILLAKLVDKKEGIFQIVTSTGEVWNQTLTYRNDKNAKPVYSSWSEFKIEGQTMVAYVEEMGTTQPHEIGQCVEVNI